MRSGRSGLWLPGWLDSYRLPVALCGGEQHLPPPYLYSKIFKTKEIDRGYPGDLPAVAPIPFLVRLRYGVLLSGSEMISHYFKFRGWSGIGRHFINCFESCGCAVFGLDRCARNKENGPDGFAIRPVADFPRGISGVRRHRGSLLRLHRGIRHHRRRRSRHGNRRR